VKELKGFGKTKLLQPGESETLRIIIPKEELKYYDEAKHGWTLTAGTYTMNVGANVEDIRGKADVDVLTE
jgi:beta-glucosidase